MIDALPSTSANSLHHSLGAFYQSPPESPLLRQKKAFPDLQCVRRKNVDKQVPQGFDHQQDGLQGPASSTPCHSPAPQSSSSSPPPTSVSQVPWRSPSVQKKLAASRAMSHQLQPKSSSSSSSLSLSSSSSHVFSERLALMSKFFDLCNPCEQVVSICALVKKMKKRHIKFLGRIFDQRMTKSFSLSEDDADDGEEDNDDEKLEEEANDPDFIRSLSGQDREVLIGSLLTRIPLLKTGNNAAKQEYLKLMPKAISFPADCSSDLSSSKARQLLTYFCIHPALNRNEYTGFAFLLNGADALQVSSSSSSSPSPKMSSIKRCVENNNSKKNERVHRHSQNSKGGEDLGGDGRTCRGSDSGNTSDNISDVGEKFDRDGTRKESQVVAEKQELDEEITDGCPAFYAESHNNQEQRGSARVSLLSCCSSRDSGIYISGQCDASAKRCLVPSLSVPVSRETVGDEVTKNDLTFVEKMIKVGGRNRVSFPSTVACVPSPRATWNAFEDPGDKTFAFSVDGRENCKPPKPASPVPKAEGHLKLSRTRSLVPDWLNKVHTAEDLTNTTSRMRFILGPNSSHLPLSPQSSTNSTDSNESQSESKLISETKDSDWSMILSVWLKSLRLHKYFPLLQNLNYEELISLNEDWLVQKDVTKGARDKLLLNVKKLQERPKLIDAMEENLKNNPDSLQTTIVELMQMLKMPMKRGDDQAFPDSRRYCFPHRLGEFNNLPGRIINLLGKMRTELLVSKQYQTDSALCTSYLRLVQMCSNHTSFTEDQKKKLLPWGHQVNKMHNSINRSFEGNRNFLHRNSSNRFPGLSRASGFHQPLTRRSTAMPVGGGYSTKYNGSHNQHQPMSGNAPFSQNFQNCLASGFDLKPNKVTIGRTHSAPLDGNISPNMMIPNKSQMTDVVSATDGDDINESPFGLDPSMEKHALGGMLQDLS